MGAKATTVLVIGGGYAGVMAANRLMSRDDVMVKLINPRPEFVERIRLHQLAAAGDPQADDSLFLKETADEWLVKYQPEKLRQKRVDLYAKMKGFA